ncbi:unnamed protein product [Symbiodinium sp. CCMP2456]|nr:unnamed protein product [Symbiodinium sp. CCMP2456]
MNAGPHDNFEESVLFYHERNLRNVLVRASSAIAYDDADDDGDDKDDAANGDDKHDHLDCTDALLKELRSRFFGAGDDKPPGIDKGAVPVKLEDVVMWIFDIQEGAVPSIKRSISLKKQKTGELEESAEEGEAIRVRTAAGSVVMSVPRKDLDKTVGQLRKEVADVFQRCIDEVKFVLDQRQLEDDERSRTLLRGEDVLELLVVTQQIPQFDGSIPAVEQLSTLILGGWVVPAAPSTVFLAVCHCFFPCCKLHMAGFVEYCLRLLLQIRSTSMEYQIDAATHLRKILSVERDPPIDKVLTLGVAPRLLELSQQMLGLLSGRVDPRKTDGPGKFDVIKDLGRMDAPTPGSLNGRSGTFEACGYQGRQRLRQQPRKLQFETLWAILNIVSGDVHQTQAIVDLDAVPIITNLLRDCTNSDVLEQGVWALGNIAGLAASGFLFSAVGWIFAGCGTGVLKVLEGTTKTSCIRNATWTVSNFCRGTPKPSLESMAPALPVMARVLYNTDQEVLTDALWTVSYVSDGTERYIQAVLDAGVCRRVVELLSHDSPQVQTPALRTVGNIVTGSDTQTDAVLACEPFPALTRLVSSPRMKIRKECCWLLSNICAGTVHQVQQVLNAGFFKVLADAARDAEHSVKKEVPALSVLRVNPRL